MKRTNKPANKLTLDTETVRTLSQRDLIKVAGGIAGISEGCPEPASKGSRCVTL